jgi:hypothetical protein
LDYDQIGRDILSRRIIKNPASRRRKKLEFQHQFAILTQPAASKPRFYSSLRLWDRVDVQRKLPGSKLH